jgi:hypothetical protein
VTLPLINSIGYDGIWFGIFVTVMCTIGLISPPTGMTVFVIQAQHPEIPVMRIYLGTLPFLARFRAGGVADLRAVVGTLAAECLVLEHDPEKACPGLDPGWEPVFGKDHARTS